MSQTAPVFIGGPGCLGPVLSRVLGSHSQLVCSSSDLIHSIAMAGKDVASAMPYLTEYHLEPSQVHQAYSKLSTCLLGTTDSESSGGLHLEVDSDCAFCFEDIYRVFPESPLVFVLRDARDLAAQELQTLSEVDDGQRVELRLERAGEVSKRWLKMILDGSAAFKRLGAHTQTCLLRFEGLVINPVRAAGCRLPGYAGGSWPAVKAGFSSFGGGLA